MKTVVIIAPQFVPCSYPPAHRVRFFTNHLRGFGWNSIVLCVDQKYMEEAPDWEFTKMISPNLEIIKVKALSPRWTRKLGIGDLGIRCLWYMLKEVRKLCRSRKIDVLFIPGPPWHTFLIGTIIKKKFGIPFVIDYIDPWVSSWGENASIFSKAYWYRKMAIMLEPFAVHYVDHIVAVSEGTNKGVQGLYPFLTDDMFTAIPYGGEPEDFQHSKQNLRTNSYWEKNDGNFHIVYVGAMLPKAYDTLRALFSALLKIKQTTGEDIYKKFRIHFFGTTYDPKPKCGLVLPIADEMGIRDIVTEHPQRVPYLDAVNILCHSDAIFCMGTTEKHYTASKIFPCILANRPLLAVYHEASSVVSIVNETNAGKVIMYNDDIPVEMKVDEISTALISLHDNKMKPRKCSNMEAFESYTAKAMTEKLVSVFNRVTYGMFLNKKLK